MKLLATIGQPASSITYDERKTVKVIIRNKSGEVLLVNEGLLPGGGVEHDEEYVDALKREVKEECGLSIKNVSEIGIIEQYRDFLRKRYVIYGYVADVDTVKYKPNPQDNGEVSFILKWLSLKNAISTTKTSIFNLKKSAQNSDNTQGALYNRETTLTLLESYNNNLPI